MIYYLAIFKKIFHVLAVLAIVLLASSCRDDFETSASTGNLEFSKDTVYLDTVFTNLGSSTYRLKVYNRSDKDISIPRVALGRANSSLYRLNVDGVAGKEFENVEILAKDSIFVFIETTVDHNDFASSENNFLYTDAIQFESLGMTQQVQLVTLIQDAVFLYPSKNAQGVVETLNLGVDDTGQEIRVEGFILEDDELIFTDEKPYVIYGYMAVAENKTLQIQAGARLHFHENSGIIVGSQGRLEINGAPSMDQSLQENEVILEGDRLEPLYNDIPGQWGTIWLTPKSTSSISHATIKNATIGIIADTENDSDTIDVTVDNTQIYNSSNIGLYCVNSSLTAKNLVVNNAGLSSVWLRLGGNYDFKHCTIANYYNQGVRNFPALTIDNYLEDVDQVLIANLEKASFANCIIYGNENTEIGIDQVEGTLFNFMFSNTLIRFQDTFDLFQDNALYDFNDTSHYVDNLFNISPDFKNTAENDLIIGEESGANSLGNAEIAQLVPFDLLGVDRTGAPDSGAYQSILFED